MKEPHPHRSGKTMLTRDEAAMLMRVSVSTIDRARKRGDLRDVKSAAANGTVRIARDDLYRWRPRD